MQAGQVARQLSDGRAAAGLCCRATLAAWRVQGQWGGQPGVLHLHLNLRRMFGFALCRTWKGRGRASSATHCQVTAPCVTVTPL